MHKPNEADGRNERHRLLNAKLNARVFVALLLALTVVLAGCTSIGGLGSGNGEDSDAGSGVEDSATAGGNSGDATEDGSEDGSSDDSANDANTATEGTESGTSDGTTESGDGTDESVDARDNGATKATIEPRSTVWLNLSKNGYVFEIVDPENGTGTATYPPPTDPNNLSTMTFEGEGSFEQSYVTKANETGSIDIVTNPLALAGYSGYVDQENLTVGYERTDMSNGTEITTKITGTASYGGVGCYATEVRSEGQLVLKTCHVPYTDEATSIGYSPYAAFYDEEGDLVIEVKVTEIQDG